MATTCGCAHPVSLRSSDTTGIRERHAVRTMSPLPCDHSRGSERSLTIYHFGPTPRINGPLSGHGRKFGFVPQKTPATTPSGAATRPGIWRSAVGRRPSTRISGNRARQKAQRILSWARCRLLLGLYISAQHGVDSRLVSPPPALEPRNQVLVETDGHGVLSSWLVQSSTAKPSSGGDRRGVWITRHSPLDLAIRDALESRPVSSVGTFGRLRVLRLFPSLCHISLGATLQLHLWLPCER